MLKISTHTTFYVICPAHFASGGPEDLHQLAAELRNNGFRVFMHYLEFKRKEFSSPVHKEYDHFQLPYAEKIDNKSQNILIFPETYCLQLWDKKYSEVQKIVWWLSVTNFFLALEKREKYLERKNKNFIKRLYKDQTIPTVDKVRDTNALHIAHSYFSLDFLNKNHFNVLGQIQDYMDDMFYENEEIKSKKKNIVIYNGMKNGEFLEKIKEKSQDLHWLEMKNMTLSQIADCMKTAKVYVDFGYHPGKEKMPREACLLDCCLIIGKEGSAKFKEDMPIKDEYHFEKEEQNIPQIIDTIKDCLTYYDIKINDFLDYKNVLLREKETFRNDVKKIFYT